MTGRISQTASSATQKLQTVAGGAAEELDQLGQLVAVLSQRLEAQTADIAGEITGTGEGITKTVQGASDQFRSLMEANRVRFAESTGETQRSSSPSWRRSPATIWSVARTRGARFSSFDQVQENVVERIEGATREFGAGSAIPSPIMRYADRPRHHQSVERVHAKADELAQGFDSNVAKTFERIGSKAGGLTSTFQARTEELVAAFDLAIEEFSGNVGGTAKELTTSLETTAQGLARTFDVAASSLSGRVDYPGQGDEPGVRRAHQRAGRGNGQRDPRSSPPCSPRGRASSPPPSAALPSRWSEPLIRGPGR